MVTESSLDMLSEFGVGTLRGSGGSGGEDVGKELGGVLREQRRQQQEASNLELELNLYRSGSAPPTVEGSLSAVGGVFRSIGGLTAGSELSGSNGALSEEELRSDPAYHSYYYSHVNLNPRLPPPILSKEDSRFAQRLQAGGSSAGLGGIGDRRKAANGSQVENGGSRSLFALQRGFDSQKEENEVEGMKSQPNEWLERGGDGLIGLPGLGLMGRKKSFGDILQDDLGCATFRSAHPSRPVSRNAVDNSMEAMASAEAQFAQLRHEITSTATLQGIPGSGSHSFASTLGTSLSRSTTPDPQMVARVPSPRLPPVGERIDKKFFNGSTSFMKSSNVTESTDLIAALSSMNLSANGMVDESYHLQSKRQSDIEAHQNSIFDLQGDQAHIKKPHYNQIKSVRAGMKHSPFLADELSASSGDTFLKIPNSPTSINMRASPHFQNLESPNQVDASYGLGTYSLNPASPSIIGSQLGASNLPPLFENVSAVASALAGSTFNSRLLGGLPLGPNSNGIAAEMQNVTGLGNHAALHMPMMDPLYFQYLKSAEYAAQLAVSLNDPSLNRNLMGSSYVDQLELQKAYLETLLSPQNSQFGIPFMGTSSTFSHGYYGNSAVGLDMSYPRSPMLPAPPLGPGSPIRHNDRPLCFTSGMRGFAGSAMGSCRTDISFNMDEGFASSLLENFKSNKTKCFELSEISGHVVEFSADQYGSRFIQQKLETATTEEKDTVFKEIIPHALSLMTDVFGNYVIQKFFEHGSAEQRRELANQLTGHVLTLSLQMYGCRVIQKAIEVVDLDQQTKMVAELEGNIMRCVRDQNGNHVIQKCIECIPQDAIEFIISSFYDQVVTLSTHPYGCRVIQRVLEHCDDPKTQQIMMDEILHSVCMLAQDQYGNYVVQHVLEHGKPHERAAIIQKLAGQIVQMSQQKFASNVVEKCLTFGEPEERQFLVNEMLGTTDENEPLQAMMKDQFANYVVQKVLETCEDHQRELILSRIKVHLNALKKYTYGKHIVARVEKLVAAGERRIGMQSAYPSSLMDKKEGYLYS